MCALALAVLACLAGPALAFDESTSTIPSYNEANCGGCHQPYPDGLMDGHAVHGGYATATRKCASCHYVHTAATTSTILLTGATIRATCFTCHDGTQGRGVYGAIAARGLLVGATHRVETTRAVPGGDPSTGGTSTMDFGGPSHTLNCDSCHNPHAADVVAAFTPERYRSTGMPPPRAGLTTNNLLKQAPGNGASSTPVYGSDWCGACHKGRLSGGAVHNHPVDSVLTTTTPFYYERVARLATDTPTGTTVFGTIGLTNRGYLMPMPRTVQQAGHNPICQQCHEDSRFVGTVATSGAPADAATWTVTSMDGNAVTDNPRFQNFPHETQNPRFLIEVNDDLCTNCHAPGALP
jgi:predicted CXXCH cytochrome family protein